MDPHDGDGTAPARPALRVVHEPGGIDLAAAAEHALIHAVPRLTAATVHTDHVPTAGHDPHASLAHHGDRPPGVVSGG
ncbi:hypothetical protein [Streptomyces kebangsaanensis]|uniref:hypothetical protein n=1 Tax=Streptomyces kebangsaanensis TaxID=864058 RepID=UPI00093BE1B9|nr:hypothetical protein [Streptomyces kebangsaanensis]